MKITKFLMYSYFSDYIRDKKFLSLDREDVQGSVSRQDDVQGSISQREDLQGSFSQQEGVQSSGSLLIDRLDNDFKNILGSLFIISYNDNRISISYNPNFVVEQQQGSIATFIQLLENIFESLTTGYNYNGYINNPNISVKGLDILIKNINLLKSKVKDKEKYKDYELLVQSPSYITNVLYFNLVLLGLHLAILQIEKSTVIKLEEDLNADLKVLKRRVMTMINPVIKDRISNKIVTVNVNGFVGFDTEYDLECSKTNKNRLLSIQLASTTGITIIVPKSSLKPLKAYDFDTKSPSGWSDDQDIKILTDGIDSLIGYYRDTYLCRSVKAIDAIHKQFLELKMDKFDCESFAIYTIAKNPDPYRTMIRHFYYSFNDNVPSITKYPLIPSSYFKDEASYSMGSLLSDSESMVDIDHRVNVKKLLSLIDKILNKHHDEPQESSSEEAISHRDERVEKVVKGPCTRVSYGLGDEKITFTIWKNLYVILHESSADLSMLSDFSKYKKQFDIINRSFVTMGKPIPVKKFVDTLEEVLDINLLKAVGSRIIFRDTILIAPSSAKSLKAIGKIYGEAFKKVDIGVYREGLMGELRSKDPELFDKYAIQDAIITLKHGVSMEEFNLSLGRAGVPLTMSGLGKTYVELQWALEGYKGYQLDGDVLIGDLGTSLTPKKSRNIAFTRFIVAFIASYRGGRNESFQWGCDNTKTWYDYDLTSCYTTVMSILATPDYNKARVLSGKEISKKSDLDLIFNYMSIDVDFVFPDDVLYPCIPTRVDNNVDIYPLKGTSTITGVEFMIARAMGCKLTVKNCVSVPFKAIKNTLNITDTKGKTKGKTLTQAQDQAQDLNKAQAQDQNQTPKVDLDIIKIVLNNFKSPFRSIVKKLQAERRKHPKKSFLNLLFKEIANSIYGQIAMGLSGKNKFDVGSNSYKKIQGSFLTNPILASYITGFNRALIAECLHNISILGGEVVSVTTDGFITDIENLEQRILDSSKTTKTLLLIYRELRTILTTFGDDEKKEKVDPSALEVKTVESLGLLSIKTRGQLGLSGRIVATTGFQNKGISREWLYEYFHSIITKEGPKTFSYVMNRLLGATDIFKDDTKNVQLTYADRTYDLSFDDRRRIVDKNQIVEVHPVIDPSELPVVLIDNARDDGDELQIKEVNENTKFTFSKTKPWASVDEYAHIRNIKNLVSKPVYNKGYVYSSGNSYKEQLETSVRGFIVACVSKYNRYGIPSNAFNSYREITDFIHDYEPAKRIKITPSMISNLKNRNTIPRSVPRNEENENFVNYVKSLIPTFETEKFFKDLSREALKALKDERENLKSLKQLINEEKVVNLLSSSPSQVNKNTILLLPSPVKSDILLLPSPVKSDILLLSSPVNSNILLLQAPVNSDSIPVGTFNSKVPLELNNVLSVVESEHTNIVSKDETVDFKGSIENINGVEEESIYEIIAVPEVSIEEKKELIAVPEVSIEEKINSNVLTEKKELKRGRGRPRKTPIEEVTIEQVPRKRGRPRKNTASVVVVEENTSRKKRGRPRKN